MRSIHSTLKALGKTTLSRKARRELCWIALFLSCVPIVYLLVAGDRGYLQLRQHRILLREVREDNRFLWEHHEGLQRRVEQLGSDPRAIERIAREQNGLARPGDIIVNLPRRQEQEAEAANRPTLD